MKLNFEMFSFGNLNFANLNFELAFLKLDLWTFELCNCELST